MYGCVWARNSVFVCVCVCCLHSCTALSNSPLCCAYALTALIYCRTFFLSFALSLGGFVVWLWVEEVYSICPAKHSWNLIVEDRMATSFSPSSAPVGGELWLSSWLWCSDQVRPPSYISVSLARRRWGETAEVTASGAKEAQRLSQMTCGTRLVRHPGRHGARGAGQDANALFWSLQ